MKVYDSDGNEFAIIGGRGNILILKGTNGEKEIHAKDLKSYTAYPLDVIRDMEKILEMVKSGELTVDMINKFKEIPVSTLIQQTDG